MNDFDFCKSRLNEIVTLTAAPDELEAKVKDFMTKRMPIEPVHRQKLRAWAQADLAEQEAMIGSGKTLPLGMLSGINHRMAMLQTVIREIDAVPASAKTD